MGQSVTIHGGGSIFLKFKPIFPDSHPGQSASPRSKNSSANAESAQNHFHAAKKKRRSDFRIPSGLQEDTPLKKHRLVLFSVDIRQDATARLQVSSF
jgi:hypothetical protein